MNPVAPHWGLTAASRLRPQTPNAPPISVGRLWLALPAALVYYATVAAADNWSGAVCNLGRYAMPVVPVLVALVAVVLARTAGRRGVLALALMMAAWSALLSRALWLDPHAANDCALLLAKGDIADGNVYVPNLFIRAWSEALPGTFARIAAWIAMAGVLALWVRRVATRGGGDRPLRTVAAVTATALALALVLERWPGARTTARFGDAIELAPGTTAFVSGAAAVEDGTAVADSGEVVLLVRSRAGVPSVRMIAEGEGLLRVPGGAPVLLRGRAVEIEVPLETLRQLTGRRGVQETLSRQAIAVSARWPGSVRLSPTSPERARSGGS